MAEDDPDAVSSEFHVPRKAPAQQPIPVALDDGDRGDFFQDPDWFGRGSIARMQNVIHPGIRQALQDGGRQVFGPIRDMGVRYDAKGERFSLTWQRKALFLQGGSTPR